MSDISRAFQLCQNGAEAELASMLQSRSIDAAACQTTGMFSGWSLLHAAASKGHMRIVQMLLAAGAPASVCNPKSKTPAQVARDKGHSAVAALLQQAEASAEAALGAAAEPRSRAAAAAEKRARVDLTVSPPGRPRATGAMDLTADSPPPRPPTAADRDLDLTAGDAEEEHLQCPLHGASCRHAPFRDHRALQLHVNICLSAPSGSADSLAPPPPPIFPHDSGTEEFERLMLEEVLERSRREVSSSTPGAAAAEQPAARRRVARSAHEAPPAARRRAASASRSLCTRCSASPPNRGYEWCQSCYVADLLRHRDIGAGFGGVGGFGGFGGGGGGGFPFGGFPFGGFPLGGGGAFQAMGVVGGAPREDATYEELLALDANAVSQGLSRAQMSALASRRYLGERDALASKGEASCVICLCEYDEGDEMHMLPCAHGFHKKCVSQWLKDKPTCPACQRDVREDLRS